MERYFLYIDGAARGNPGPAGVGIVISDAKGRVIETISKYIGENTNNVAEYTALVFGMDQLRKIDAKDIVINTDSELLAKQLGGEYKVKSPALKSLYDKVTQMLVSFDEVRINQIGREKNKQADELANQAIDKSFKDKRAGSSFILKSKKSKDSLF
ncbi:MAG: ribonuclease HI family protein [Candidatus Omnitrophota bacterium]